MAEDYPGEQLPSGGIGKKGKTILAILNDQVALVTGASRGIGAAIVRQLRVMGARVVLAARNLDSLQALQAEVDPSLENTETVVCDVANSGDLENLVAAAQAKWGRLDILVNNAGITRDGLLMRMKDEDWDVVLNTNLRSAFITTRAAAKIMLRQKSGRIINITSVIGVTGNAGQANYAASKAGLIGLTKSTAKELASRGICVNAVAPGYIETDMTSGLADKVRDQILQQIPLQALGKPEDVAAMVGFLTTPGSRYITGQVFHVDGGMVI